MKNPYQQTPGERCDHPGWHSHFLPRYAVPKMEKTARAVHAEPRRRGAEWAWWPGFAGLAGKRKGKKERTPTFNEFFRSCSPSSRPAAGGGRQAHASRQPQAPVLLRVSALSA